MIWLTELDERFLVHAELRAVWGAWLAWETWKEVIGNDTRMPIEGPEDARFWWWVVQTYFFEDEGMGLAPERRN